MMMQFLSLRDYLFREICKMYPQIMDNKQNCVKPFNHQITQYYVSLRRDEFVANCLINFNERLFLTMNY